MRIRFGASLVQVFNWRAGEFKLPARLQRDIAAVSRQSDGFAAFFQACPSELIRKAVQNGTNAIRPLICWPAKITQPEHKLLVLRADAPVAFRL